jgi:hypothetical protein
MDCQTTACAVDRLNDSLSGPDWLTFATTLLATLVGAGLSALVTVLVFRRERGDQQRGAVTSGLARVVDEIGRHMGAIQTHADASEAWSMAIAMGQRIAPPTRPNAQPLIAAVEALSIVCSKADRPVVSQAIRVVNQVLYLGTSQEVLGTLQVLRSGLVAWRGEHESVTAATALLKTLPVAAPDTEQPSEPSENDPTRF